MTDYSDVAAIVMDNGSGICKAGLAGDDAPTAVIPSVIGRPTSDMRIDDLPKEHYIGNDVQAVREMLSLKYPIEHGIITDWDDMEKMWHHMFHKELGMLPEEHPLELTEAPLSPRFQREKMAQVAFETFNVPMFHVSVESILAQLANGRVSAVNVNIGDGVAHVLPIYEGHCVYTSIRRMDLGGRDLTTYLQRLLHQRGYAFTTSAEIEEVRQMKETLGYVSIDCANEVTSDVSYELPDGNTVTIGNERFRCAEALFQPSLLGMKSHGVHEMLFEALEAAGLDTLPDIYCNVCVYGGSTMFPGFAERLKNEIKPRVNNLRFNVIAPPERKYSVWIGGSILTSLSSMRYYWISKQDYEEHGPTIMNRKVV